MSDTPRTDAIVRSMPAVAGLPTLERKINELLKLSCQLERELAAARKDAERYRYIKLNGGIPLDAMHDSTLFDAAIDAAMEAK